MTFHYAAYGLTFSSDLPIPGLTCVASTPEQVKVHFTDGLKSDVGDEANPFFFASDSTDEFGEPILRAWKLPEPFGYRLRYCDGIEFVLDEFGKEIWCSRPSNMTIEDVFVYLMGPIFGFVLRLRGQTCLHASVINIDDQAVALVGPGGSGKSTTAAAFVELGFPILTDDVAAIRLENGSCSIEPAYPHVRLWPQAVNMLYGHHEALPRLVPVGTWDKCYLNLENRPELFCTRPLPLRAVYTLETRLQEDQAPSIRPLSQAEAMLSLLANGYANNLIDRSLRAEEFRVLSSIATSIPIKSIYPHCDEGRLPELCEVIIRDVRSQRGASH
ncbi:MAG TPA: hypothetical protein VL866_22020 [Pyrinomonadaceae bacterium]|nr:hypothetical protein [Pyrinomonadaceae bacterium]